MPQTMQSISHMLVEKAKKQCTMSLEPETEDNLSLMFSVCSSLNNLCIKLEKLYHIIKMTNVKLRIKDKYEEKASPHSGAVQLTLPHRIRRIRKRLKKEERK